MPTPPDFTAGTALAAASLNKIGLWEVTSVTVGSAVSSVSVSNAFSATYDDYLVKFTGGTTSTSTNFVVHFGSTTTEYYGSYYYDLYTGAVTGTVRRSNGANLYIGTAGGVFEGRQSTTFTVASPYLAQRTTIHGMNYGAGYSGWFGGEQYSTTSFTSFTIAPTAGTMTGGTITVYGYGKA